ncbi:hypothetical protein BHM03_00017063 [Ensete ventricosum]|nr:hypothetical protein BHM03_00017063 [Ensete ventricosum]
MEAAMGFSAPKPHVRSPPALRSTTGDLCLLPKAVDKLLIIHQLCFLTFFGICAFDAVHYFSVALLLQFRSFPASRWTTGLSQCNEGTRQGRSSSWKLNALPDWPLMAVMIEHVANQRDYVVHKSIWHLSDEAMKNVYTAYIMFTCWGCCFFGSTKVRLQIATSFPAAIIDDQAHGCRILSTTERSIAKMEEMEPCTGSMKRFQRVIEQQEDIEEAARAELWREELIEEIEQKVGGLRELEEAGKQEELVK